MLEILKENQQEGKWIKYTRINLAQEPTGPASSSCDRMSTSRQRKLNSTLNQMALKTRFVSGQVSVVPAPIEARYR